MIDIPLYQLEHARRKLDRLDWDHRDPDFETVRDLLDEVIEAKRRVNDAHRVTVATGGNREARL